MSDQNLDDRVTPLQPRRAPNAIEAIQSSVSGPSDPRRSENASGQNLISRTFDALVSYFFGFITGGSVGIGIASLVAMVWKLMPDSAPDGLSAIGVLFTIVLIMALLGSVVAVEYKARRRCR
jgi:hypothetical protein